MQLKVCGAIDKEELLFAVGGDGLGNERCRALTASQVNVFAKALIGHIHLTYDWRGGWLKNRLYGSKNSEEIQAHFYGVREMIEFSKD